MAITQMTSGGEFQTLAQQRIKEARTLFAADPDCASGSYYLAGYAVECALKACIVKLSVEDFYRKSLGANYFSHDLKKLLDYAGLTLPARPVVQENWRRVILWTEESRYRIRTVAQAQASLDAIDDPAEGILTWLVTQW